MFVACQKSGKTTFLTSCKHFNCVKMLLISRKGNPDGSLSNYPSLRILWPEGLFRQPVCSVTVIPVFSVGSTVFFSGAPIRHFHGKPDVSYRRPLFPRAIPCREKLQIAYSPALSPSVPVGLFFYSLFFGVCS